MDKLDEYRKEIEKIDSEIALLFEKRMDVSKKIGKYKKENNIPIFDPKREESLKNKNSLIIKKEYQDLYLELLDLILKLSKKVQL